MDRFVKAFIKASVVWLTLGATLGAAMALVPAWIVYRPAHLHMLTLGFVAMMIFGIGYHVIPRIVGHPLVKRDLPLWHWWVSHVGLALMAAGFVLRAEGFGLSAPVLATGGALSALGAYMFAYLIWRTVDGPDAVRRRVQRESDRQRATLPVLELIQGSGERETRAQAVVPNDARSIGRRRAQSPHLEGSL